MKIVVVYNYGMLVKAVIAAGMLHMRSRLDKSSKNKLNDHELWWVPKYNLQNSRQHSSTKLRTNEETIPIG